MKKPVGTLATVGVVLALVVLLGNAWISYRNTRQLMGSEAWVEHTQVVLAEIDSVRAMMSDAVAAERGYLLVRDEAFLAPYEKAKLNVGERVDALKNLTADNSAQQSRVGSLQGAIAREFKSLESGIELSRSGTANAAAGLGMIQESKAGMDGIRGTLDEMGGRGNVPLEDAERYDNGELSQGAGDVRDCDDGGGGVGGAFVSFDSAG